MNESKRTGKAEGLRVERLIGGAVVPYLKDVGELRIAVFREWPYLYDGSAESEAAYLRHHAACARSCTVLVVDGQQVVGASTALPLPEADPAFQKPFIERGIDPAAVCYFGESVLLPEYRGRGLGKRFFEERLAYAREGGARWAAFCAVERAADDVRRPDTYRPLDSFWKKQGFVAQSGMRAFLSWRGVGETAESVNSLGFWLRELAD